MVYTDGADFEWDNGNVDHIARHGIEPWEPEDVLLDPRRYVYPAARGEERRFIAVGAASDGRMLAVVYTIRSAKVRVVTAREAQEWERRRYRRRR